MKVLVCGGRDFTDKAWLWSVLDAKHLALPIRMIIQGEARGADTLAKEWAASNKVPCLSVPADWEAHGKRAGFIRNALMLTFEPDLVLATPGGKGTNMMCVLAEKKGTPIEYLRIQDATDQDSRHRE